LKSVSLLPSKPLLLRITDQQLQSHPQLDQALYQENIS
jgi:hypothetical protein